MTTRDPEAGGPPTEAAREGAEYAARIRRTNERLALSVAVLLAVVSFLPLTRPEHRTGVLATAVVLFVATIVWFRVVPPTAFGDRRVLIFGVLLQPVTIVLLSLTGGSDSPYLPFLLLPILTTIYSPSTRHTLVIGAVSAISLLIAALIARETIRLILSHRGSRRTSSSSSRSSSSRRTPVVRCATRDARSPSAPRRSLANARRRSVSRSPIR